MQYLGKFFVTESTLKFKFRQNYNFAKFFEH